MLARLGKLPLEIERLAHPEVRVGVAWILGEDLPVQRERAAPLAIGLQLLRLRDEVGQPGRRVRLRLCLCGHHQRRERERKHVHGHAQL